MGNGYVNKSEQNSMNPTIIIQFVNSFSKCPYFLGSRTIFLGSLKLASKSHAKTILPEVCLGRRVHKLYVRLWKPVSQICSGSWHCMRPDPGTLRLWHPSSWDLFKIEPLYSVVENCSNSFVVTWVLTLQVAFKWSCHLEIKLRMYVDQISQI